MFKKVLVVVSVLALGTPVLAKDLVSRLGVGVKQSSALDNLPEITVVYHTTPEISVTGGVGIDTKKDYSKFSFNGGVRRIVFKENNMNFYMGARLGLVNFETPGNKKSGFELSGLFGGEFFFSGLENLAFTFEGGVGVVSTSDVRFRTIGDSPFGAGIVFYF